MRRMILFGWWPARARLAESAGFCYMMATIELGDAAWSFCQSGTMYLITAWIMLSLGVLMSAWGTLGLRERRKRKLKG